MHTQHTLMSTCVVTCVHTHAYEDIDQAGCRVERGWGGSKSRSKQLQLQKSGQRFTQKDPCPHLTSHHHAPAQSTTGTGRAGIAAQGRGRNMSSQVGPFPPSS